MILERLTPDEYYAQQEVYRDQYYANEMYLAYCNQFLYEFREKYPTDRRLDYNYTRGFNKTMEKWCEELDPKGWTLYRNYGHFWPIGFSRPEYVFAFKMRWL